MSGLNLASLQEIIAARVRAEFPNYEVREDDIIDNGAVLKNDGKVKPYIVLLWNGLVRSTANANFGGVRLDEYSSSVDVVLVAPTGSQARRGLTVILDSLIGWKPAGSSALTPSGNSGVYPVNTGAGRPHVYAASGRLRFSVNGEDPGAPIAP